MCVSRVCRVLACRGEHASVEDADGRRLTVSLLALDGPPLEPGAWLVVHSGYAIARLRDEDAQAVLAALRAGGSGARADATGIGGSAEGNA